MLWWLRVASGHGSSVSRHAVGAAYGEARACGALGILRLPMPRTPFDELVHRVNNLLGTIEIQAELARSDGTLAAHVEALARIAESAARTHAEVQRLRAATTDRA